MYSKFCHFQDNYVIISLYPISMLYYFDCFHMLDHPWILLVCSLSNMLLYLAWYSATEDFCIDFHQQYWCIVVFVFVEGKAGLQRKKVIILFPFSGTIRKLDVCNRILSWTDCFGPIFKKIFICFALFFITMSSLCLRPKMYSHWVLVFLWVPRIFIFLILDYLICFFRVNNNVSLRFLILIIWVFNSFFHSC